MKLKYFPYWSSYWSSYILIHFYKTQKTCIESLVFRVDSKCPRVSTFCVQIQK